MIIAAEVKRDEQGYWTHPALVGTVANSRW